MTVQKKHSQKKHSGAKSSALAAATASVAALIATSALAEQPPHETVVVGGKSKAAVEVSQEVLNALGPPRARSALKAMPTPWASQRPAGNTGVSYQPMGAPQAVSASDPTWSRTGSGAPALVQKPAGQPLSDLDWDYSQVPASNIQVIATPSGQGGGYRAMEPVQVATVDSDVVEIESRYLEMARQLDSKPAPGLPTAPQSYDSSAVPESSMMFKQATRFGTLQEDAGRGGLAGKVGFRQASRIPDYDGPGVKVTNTSSGGSKPAFRTVTVNEDYRDRYGSVATSSNNEERVGTRSFRETTKPSETGSDLTFREATRIPDQYR